MPLIVYLDETGDHSLDDIDEDFPIFALVMLVCDVDEYCEVIVPKIHKLKMEFFGHDGVILHSRDIRKAQGDFGILTNQTKKASFLEKINSLMSELNYTLLASVINKKKHKDRYQWPDNPYDIAFKFTMERLLPLLENSNETEIKLIAEARGKNEDDDLRRAFLEITTRGTEYIGVERFEWNDLKGSASN